MGEHMIELAAGSLRIGVLPARGRVMSLRLRGVEALWQNPAWAGDWNIGGDRLWLSPERDWFFHPGAKKGDFVHRTPRAIDPGEWEWRTGRGGVTMEMEARLKRTTSSERVRVRVSRTIGALPATKDPDAIVSAGFTTDHALDVLSGATSPRVGLWSLAQLPHGGTAYVGVMRPRSWRAHYGRGGARQEEGRVQIQFVERRFKYGFAPGALTGRMAYVRRVGDVCIGVARLFGAQSWGVFTDSPMRLPPGPGDGAQVYCDDGRIGGFGEIEHHTPGVRVGEPGVRERYATIVSLIEPSKVERWLARWV